MVAECPWRDFSVRHDSNGEVISKFVFSLTERESLRNIYGEESEKRRETKRKHPGNGQKQREIRAGEGAQSNAQVMGECRGAIGASDTAQRREKLETTDF